MGILCFVSELVQHPAWPGLVGCGQVDSRVASRWLADAQSTSAASKLYARPCDVKDVSGYVVGRHGKGTHRAGPACSEMECGWAQGGKTMPHSKSLGMCTNRQAVLRPTR